MKKILLIQPSPYDKNHKPVKKNKSYFVGLAMPLLQPCCLKAGMRKLF